MPSINLDLNYFTHPKVIRLVACLGESASLYPLKLWVYVGKYHCEQGMLEAYSKQEIEAVVGWGGESGKCIDELVRIGFLEKIENGYLVHDWKEHSGHLAVYKKRAKSAAKKRWKKHASSMLESKSSNALAIQCNTIHNKKKKRLTDDEFLEELRKNPAYSHVNFPVELGKMDAWFLTPKGHGRKKTRQFILNWLNKIDAPMTQPQLVQPYRPTKVVL